MTPQISRGKRIFEGNTIAAGLGAVSGQALMIFAAAGVTIILWGLVPTTTRIATAQMDGVAVGVLRAAGPGILLLPILVLLRVQLPRNRGQWRLLGVSALGGCIGFPVLFSIGMQRTSACHAALIMAALPLFTGLIGATFEMRPPRPQWVVGAAIALAGEAILIALGANESVSAVLGTGNVLG
jgi:drug/metabolite transporter (DMT)-like permease